MPLPVPISDRFHQITVELKNLADKISSCASTRDAATKHQVSAQREADTHQAEAQRLEKEPQDMADQRTKVAGGADQALKPARA